MPTEDIHRYYDWTLEEQGEEYVLVTLCESCAISRGSEVDHADTPDLGEEMECEECGAINEQAAIWRIGMFNHNLGG